ncbi:MAG: hypothetical protein ACTSR8_18700 [Promethearchaeota archaeon]
MNFSAQYYNRQASGLGLDFLEEIEKSIHLLKESPERWPTYDKIMRKYNSK